MRVSGELGLLVLSLVRARLLRLCYDTARWRERSTNHCFIIPTRTVRLTRENIKRDDPKGSSWVQTTVLNRVSGGCHLCAPRLTQRQCMGSQCIANAKEGRRALGRWCCAARSAACAQAAPSRTVSISKGRVARPRATDHQLIDVGQGTCALPHQIRWEQ